MKRSTYTDEFKAEAVKQITERGHGVLEVSKRLGVSDKSLYVWLKRSQQRSQSPVKADVSALKGERARMKAELKRTTEERDILKKAAVLRQSVRVKYAFIDRHRHEFRLSSMCRVLKVHRSGSRLEGLPPIGACFGRCGTVNRHQAIL